MSARLFAINRWADRAPASRYPALLLSIVLLIGLAGGITGCGGSDDTATPAGQPITAQSTAQAGDANTGASVLVLPLLGPVITLQQPATVRVHLSGVLEQTAHYSAFVQVGIALSAPVQTGESTRADVLTPHAATTVKYDYEVTLTLPAGDTALDAQLTVRATDGAGQPTAALAVAITTADWTVQVLQ